jgi:ATP-dependent Clp protease ATP-binding subunit ClpC
MNEALSLGRDLTELARQGKLDPVVGREREIDEVLCILCRRTKSNPLLLGDPGVGKTALVEGLAQMMATGVVPLNLRGRRLFELQLGALMAGTQFRGDLEKRVQDFLGIARKDRTIVFIDEIHLLVVAGRGSGMDAANLLKPVLARGEVPCIGATTHCEALEMFRTDAAMERRFQSVSIDEPSPETVEIILRSARSRLESHHRLKISDEAIRTTVSLSLQQQNNRKNPDRALDILEDACASEQLRISRLAGENARLAPELPGLVLELNAAIEALDIERHVRARAALSAIDGAEWQGRYMARIEADHVRESVAKRAI